MWVSFNSVDLIIFAIFLNQVSLPPSGMYTGTNTISWNCMLFLQSLLHYLSEIQMLLVVTCSIIQLIVLLFSFPECYWTSMNATWLSLSGPIPIVLLLSSSKFHFPCPRLIVTNPSLVSPVIVKYGIFKYIIFITHILFTFLIIYSKLHIPWPQSKCLYLITASEHSVVAFVNNSSLWN
jgi:hypothetical protein